VFNFQSNKQARVNSAHQGRCVAHMFVMRVGEELAAWPEYPQRQRRWVRRRRQGMGADARVLCTHSGSGGCARGRGGLGCRRTQAAAFEPR
jgi:hypothetical protein